MTIRPMQPDDYDALYDLWLHVPGMGLNSLDDTKEGITRFLERNPSTCFVAYENGTVIGAIMAGNDGRRGYIYHTAVDERYQRRGIGKMLAEAALKALEEEGISKAALVVFSRNESGNAFWEELGFSVRDDIIYRNRSIKVSERIDT